MKKSTGVIGVVVVLGAAYLGATWYVGKEARKTIEEAVAQANTRLARYLGPDADGVKIGIADYQRRFFSSDVVYTVSLKDPDGKPVDLALHDHLQHGPFPLGALQEGHLAPLLAYSRARLAATPATQAWIDSQKGGSPLTVDTRVGFGGSGHSVWTFSPTELIEDGDTLNFSGGTVDIDFSKNFNSGSAAGQFDAFSLANAQTGESLHIKNIRLDSKTDVADGNKMHVQSSATVDTLTMDKAGDEAVAIEKLTVKLDNVQAGDMLDGSLHYDFGRVAVGPVDLGSLSLGVRANRLDLAALAALAKEYDAIQARHGGQGDQDLMLSDEEEQALREKLMAVLASDPSVAIEQLLWKNDDGQSKASLQVDFTRPADAGQGDADVLLAQALKQVRLDFSLAKPMFIRVFGQAQADPQQRLQMEMMGAMIYDQYMARLRDAGLVQVDGDTTAASVLYENDSVTVNGQAMSAAEFMQRVLSVAM
ncbi:YdgA family protein [Pollutimonas sp. M17]|uniref:YdgA family protein n=1 Tax=Pollutimonas sp. M17 TaxID=2962065 RepID=UPI0021F455A4|nr:YdgA family protein [Pollutimonas sp. M17]UYO94866.1 YdgA family protein [Pollutimonas sp. M17]